MPIAQREARRAELAEAAARAIRRIGPGASMEEMAREAGITKPILYRHFGDKAGLCQAIAEQFAARLSEELDIARGLDPDPPRELRQAIEAYLAFAERDAAIHRFLSLQTGLEGREVARTLEDFSSRLAARIAGNYRFRLVAAGREPAAAEPWAQGVMGMVTAAASWWLQTGGHTGEMSREQLTGHLVDLIWNGFGDVVEGAAGRP